MSRTARNLIGFAPDGSTVRVRTSGGYTCAGIARDRRTGRWSVITRGSSEASVGSRLRTWCNRNLSAYSEGPVIPLREEMPPLLEEYFRQRPLGGNPARMPRIVSVFGPGLPWVPAEKVGLRKFATRAALREAQRCGLTSVAIGDDTRQADFTIEALLKRQPSRPALGGSLIGSRRG